MKTLNKMIIAASIAATMGSSIATGVPGLDSSTFSFSKPGISVGDATKAGGLAIAKMNSIMDAVKSTGGSDVSKTHFWNAMVDPTERNVFNYTNAKPMIEELIFTVTGEVYNANKTGADKYEDATGTLITDWTANKKSSVAIVDANGALVLDADGNKTYGKYVDGQLSTTRTAAVNLMTVLGYAMSTDTTILQGDTEAHPYAVKFTKIASGSAGYVASTDVADLVTDGSDTSTSALALSTSTIGTAVAAAELDADGFNNANKLIELIANELKAGFILNVDNATVTLAAIADKHTGFLSASLIRDAKKDERYD